MSMRDFFGKISDAIPNEFSKMNSWNRYVKMIPFVGPFIGYGANSVAAVDRFGETYSNGEDLMGSAAYGAQAFADSSGDPNKNSPKNSMTSKQGWKDPFSVIGKAGDLSSLFNLSGLNQQTPNVNVNKGFDNEVLGSGSIDIDGSVAAKMDAQEQGSSFGGLLKSLNIGSGRNIDGNLAIKSLLSSFSGAQNPENSSSGIGYMKGDWIPQELLPIQDTTYLALMQALMNKSITDRALKVR